MSADDIAAWTTVAIGLILSGAGLKSSWYFWRQHKLLNGANSVMSSIFRTTATITAACLVLTLNRAYLLTFGPDSVWSYVLNGIMIAWILLIPWFLFHTFVRKEGAPVDRTESVIEREDREVGDERRSRQADNKP
jgi:hypothetical protein